MSFEKLRKAEDHLPKVMLASVRSRFAGVD